MNPTSNLEQLFANIRDFLTSQVNLPVGSEWAATGVLALIAMAGLMLLVRGARWAPGMVGFVFLGLGIAFGIKLANALSLPAWVGGGVVGVLAMGLGIVLFRLTQALVMGGALAGVGLAAYYVSSLVPAVDSWVHRGLDANQNITLPAANGGGETGSAANAALAQASSLWHHLSAEVANFQPTFFGIVGAGLLCGALFGWFLPRFSRSLWSATIGTVLAGMGVTGLLEVFAPSVLESLLSNNQVAWSIVGGVWLASLGINYFTCVRKPKRSNDDIDAEPGEAALA